jgi:Tfp pilus assembly protein PilW
MPKKTSGFSLVELLIALVFIGLLMAGMLQVFRADVNLFQVSNETLSARRSNRIALDLIQDDMNMAGAVIATPGLDPGGLGRDLLRVLPNNPVTLVGNDNPVTTDQFLFYTEQVLPFEGVITTPVVKDANLDGQALMLQFNGVTDIPTGYVQPGDVICLYQDAGLNAPMALVVATASKSSSSTYAVTLTATAQNQETGMPSATSSIASTSVLSSARFYIVRRGQMVRYSIQARALDPADPTHTVPCLVREQGAYSSPFAPNPALETLVAENVVGFKTYLSANGGLVWAGEGIALAGTAGESAINTVIDGQITALSTALNLSGPNQLPTVNSIPLWFRQIPMLVRFDLTTRTAVRRTEQQKTAVVAAEFRTHVQSLVFRPRQFGFAG